MNTMHTCFLCNEYPPGEHGGVGSFTQTLGRALAARGHRVTVVGCYRARRDTVENDQGVTVIRLAHTPVRSAGFILNGQRIRNCLRRIHREHPIDILEGPELSLASIPADFPTAKVIRMNGGHHFFAVTLGKKPRPWRSWLERRSFAHANHICAVSRYVGETTRELLNLGDIPIEILPNPVDITQFHPRPEIPEEEGLIIFAGTVCEKKGIRQLIQAMPQIVEAAPRAHLWVLGRDWRDPQTGASFIEYLRGFIAPKLSDRILFKGAIEHAKLPNILAQAAVCIYPSHMEAMPLAWLEGLAMGKAVVASRIGPGPEVIEDSVSGLLCDPFDPASIADKVITALTDAPLRSRLGQQARTRAVALFSQDVLVNRNEAFYSLCVQK